MNRLFFSTAGILLLIVSVAKFVSALAKTPILERPDPVLMLQNRYLFLIVAGIESVVAAYCLIGRCVDLQARLLAWLSSSFVAYRLGLAFSAHYSFCPCLGNLTDALHISPVVADNVMKGVLAYLLIGSCLVLWSDRKRGKLTPRAVNPGAAASEA